MRFARAATKRDLKSGRLGIYDLLMDPSEELKGAKVEEMLLAVRGMGRVKVTRIMREAGVSRSKTLVGLTPYTTYRVTAWAKGRKAGRTDRRGVPTGPVERHALNAGPVPGRPVPGIMKYADEQQADLIVAGSSTRPAVARLLGSVPLNLIKASSRPVLERGEDGGEPWL